MTTGPPTPDDVLTAFGHAFDLLIRFARRPVTGTILINGKGPTGMPIPIHRFTYEVQYSDDLMGQVPEDAPTTVTVVDLSDNPSTSATLTPDPSSDQKGTGEITSDTAAPFKLRASKTGGAVSITVETDELDPTPGTPTTAVVVATPVA